MSDSDAPRGPRSAARLTAGVAVAGTVATVAVVVLPFLHFAYRSPALHVVLETSNALIALLVGYLVYGRFRQGHGAQELLLVLGLCSVAVANLVLTAVPTAVTLGQDEEYSRWAAVAIRFVGTVLLATAAVTPWSLRVGRRRATVAAVSVAFVVLAVGTVGLPLGGHLPPTVDPGVDLGDTSRPLLVAHPLVLTVNAVGAVLYGAAAIAFTRRASRTDDVLLRWVGAGCVLAAFARVHYLLFPSLYADYVYSGDLLRLGFYVFLLVGATREIGSYWRAREQAAVLEDRRRMARDLHDGLTQELSYIYARSRWLATHPDDTVTVERIRRAAGRALDEARRAISTLTRPVDEPFVQTLQQFVEDMAIRHEVEVVTDLDPAVELRPDEGEQLLRIVGEAFHNAVRHGRARRIHVTFTADPLCLSLTDDGHGFDPAAVRPRSDGGFGITSMRERAQALGVELQLESAPGEGTTVRVTRP
ncbi:sensor histidine kinase [Geodermatophilus sp. SYSU D00742]